MKTLQTLILLLFISSHAFLQTSCLTNAKKQQRDRADALIQQWDSLNTAFLGIDTLSIDAYWKSFEGVIDSFNMYYHDGFQADTWEALRAFAEVKSPLKFITRNYHRTASTLKYSGNQLKDLYDDIVHRKLSVEEANEYLQTEAEELARLEEEVALLIDNNDMGLKWYAERIGPIRDAIVYMQANEDR